ncbi:prostaglandin E2 receptor EP4 subtype-like [Eriocheir sinensis]|uniref:prostaglandin E2 receptor EP4 subtype-like n=1 Tax=Eriocheir sinensis TaxID=95602 RepID=UPI0021C82C6C|nr:prostaglandin E2 receptor EP4 subtype-like [Eriocheir sinensis]XP_050736354.1 prostaglandin E2 receptor EP4 subtype-like [Eriocheir sinensis]XP_050736355.1 prostaglandin E2 receptor EP4 subtype-like [Eriocheir sinensis]XP_050736356.1 prostaglandin E2 receptor EP4 subtype-like [Eriocheir sinensis]XP_050736357.1 prostaglandin E2 receptor EP4 subtype-like [Eriocheir sinensis]XP_050736358.1 prostaglandin E2 receptor EP4 subtype-like [Eriocheir sinensis]
MLPHAKEGVSEEVVGGPERVPLGCNCGSALDVAMTDTLMQVECEANVTCTDLSNVPGATIVSPILLSLSGVAGQIWALYYLYTSTRPQHSRTVFFLLLSTLIWTDLFGKVITTTPALIAYVYGGWAGGKPLCNFHAFSMMLISLVTHFLVSTMAVERFIGIRHGYFYNKNITTTRTKLLLLGIWVFSAVFCSMPLFGVGQYALQYPGSWCFVNIHVSAASPMLHRVYTNVFGLFTLANLLIMAVCNIVVITTLLCLRLCRQQCCGVSFCQPQRTNRQRELEMQMVVVLVVITMVFLLSWTPIDIRLFLNQIWPHQTRADHYQDLIAVRLTSINQIIDPWAYIICRKVFVTRAWRWMRLSLMGSRFLGRENSSHPGSSKRTPRPPEKPIYRPTYKGVEDDVNGAMEKGVVVMVEKEALLPAPPPVVVPPPPHDPLLMAGLVEGVDTGVGLTKEAQDGFRDSGTGSHNTPSTGCSDSGTANCSMHLPAPTEDNNVVPIPVFTSQQYRMCAVEELKDHARLKRITSSASARAAPASRPAARSTYDAPDTPPGSWASWAGTQGRRHSWCCPHDGADGKQYRTQSTQTFKPDTHTHHHHHHHLHPHYQYTHYLLPPSCHQYTPQDPRRLCPDHCTEATEAVFTVGDTVSRLMDGRGAGAAVAGSGEYLRGSCGPGESRQRSS